MTDSTQDFLVRFDKFQEQLGLTPLDALDQSSLFLRGRCVVALVRAFVLWKRGVHLILEVIVSLQYIPPAHYWRKPSACVRPWVVLNPKRRVETRSSLLVGVYVTRQSVPLSEIVGGGPPKDGIPALDSPKFVSAAEARRFLSGKDRVLGVDFSGGAKAYPIRILNWHEIVNDDIHGRPITVTW